MNAAQTITTETKTEKLNRLIAALEAAIAGKRGAPEKRLRARMLEGRIRGLLAEERFEIRSGFGTRLYDETTWRVNKRHRQAFGLCVRASIWHDEHGFHSKRGDYLTTKVCDFVPWREARKAPYFDMGHAGLAFVEVERKRVYGKSAFRRVGYCSTKYLVGRNESGTYFAHAVSKKCTSVRDAINWIWNGKADNVVRRQGDVAVIRGAGPKVPTLPRGHVVDGEWLRHDTHPTIRMPGKGERLIVGRRAKVYASEETRD